MPYPRMMASPMQHRITSSSRGLGVVSAAALLAAVAVGLAPQAQASISALVGKARTVRPTAWWTEVADTRAAWFERVRRDPAVHDWRSR